MGGIKSRRRMPPRKSLRVSSRSWRSAWLRCARPVRRFTLTTSSRRRDGPSIDARCAHSVRREESREHLVTSFSATSSFVNGVDGCCGCRVACTVLEVLEKERRDRQGHVSAFQSCRVPYPTSRFPVCQTEARLLTMTLLVEWTSFRLTCVQHRSQ